MQRLRRSDWKSLVKLWEELWSAPASGAGPILDAALARRLDATRSSLDGRRLSPYEKAFAERALRAYEARRAAAQAPGDSPSPMRAIFDGVPAGILVCDSAQKIVACNARGDQILKLSLSANVGRSVHDVVRSRDGFMEGVTQVAKAGKAVTRQSMVISLDGEERTIGYSGAPILDPEGRPAGWVLLFQDISSIVSS